jgi:hypothetical protein
MKLIRSRGMKLIRSRGMGGMREFCEALETLRGKIDLGETIPYNTEEEL